MNIVKKGWHPEKDNGYSGGGGVRGSIRAMTGKPSKEAGKRHEAALAHQSAPLTTLRDPSEFGPPPKHVGVHPDAGAAAMMTGTRPAPAVPSRSDSTSTTAYSQVPTQQRTVASEAWVTPSSSHTPTAPSGPPSLPPRLPPRQNSHPDVHSPDPPPAYTEMPNQATDAAAMRLARAGVSVPGLGIGSQGNGTSGSAGQAQSPGGGAHMNELQARFARMGRTTSPSAVEGQRPQGSSGPSWQQTQQAAQTAAKFRQDPSSVSASDARGALQTASNLKQAHGDKIAAGYGSAQTLNQKYGTSDRFGGEGSVNSASSFGTSGVQNARTAGKKGPPPPPPPKKATLHGSATDQPHAGNNDAQDGGPSPPPIPLASKPR